MIGRAAVARDRQPGFTLLELVIVVAIVGILASAVLPLARWSVKRQREYELQQNLRILRNAIDRYHDMALAGFIEADPGTNGFPPDLEVLVEGVELQGQMPELAPGVSDEYAASGLGLRGGFTAAAAGGAGGGRGALSSQTSGVGRRGTGAQTGTQLGGRQLGALGRTLGQLQDPSNPLSRRLGLSQRAGLSQLAQDLRRQAGGGGGLGVMARAGEAQKIVFLRRIPVDPFTGDTDWGMRCYRDGIGDRTWCGRNVFDVYSRARGRGIDGRPYREW